MIYNWRVRKEKNPCTCSQHTGGGEVGAIGKLLQGQRERECVLSVITVSAGEIEWINQGSL